MIDPDILGAPAVGSADAANSLLDSSAGTAEKLSLLPREEGGVSAVPCSFLLDSITAMCPAVNGKDAGSNPALAAFIPE